jgi:hypothetical protein
MAMLIVHTDSGTTYIATLSVKIEALVVATAYRLYCDLGLGSTWWLFYHVMV